MSPLFYMTKRHPIDLGGQVSLPLEKRWLTGLSTWLWLMASALAINSPENSLAPRAQKTFLEAQAAFQAAPTNAVLAWQFARACRDWANDATNSAQRAERAQRGIEAARQAIARDPTLPAGHYYLAATLGQLADARHNLDALKLISEMEREFRRAREQHPTIDYAGPDRILGLLYRDAPGWPLSVGSKKKARAHLQQAVALAPDYPENHLCLLEAYLKWGERKNLSAELAKTEATLAAGRRNFAGEEWSSRWANWERRWQAIKGTAQ